MTSPRFAIYFAPSPETELWRFGSSLLGYDAATGKDIAAWHPDGIDAATWHIWTAEPRRYGFHATLKAPFQLQDGMNESHLYAAVDAFARDRLPTSPLTLRVTRMAAFLALRLAERREIETVAALARDVVVKFEPFRAPLNEADRARRLKVALTDRQIGYLNAYGYPYVLDDFRFHITLTGPLPSTLITDIEACLAQEFDSRDLCSLVQIDSLVVFRQVSPTARFKIVHRAPLTGHGSGPSIQQRMP